jgi:hypothetical protein
VLQRGRLDFSYRESFIQLKLSLVFFLSLIAIVPSSFSQCSPAVLEEAQRLRSQNEEQLTWLGQRLIDPPHWKRGTEEGHWPVGDLWSVPEQTKFDPTLPPYWGYGVEAFEHWKNAELYILEHCDRAPTLEDYQQIHSLTFYNMPGDLFWGYYSFQIWKNFPEAERAGLKELLNKAQTNAGALQQLLARGIKNGKGEFRNHGDTSWSGKPWSTPDNRYLLFGKDEYQRISRHRLLRPQPAAKSEDGIQARFWHPKGSEVPGLLSELFTAVKAEAEELKLRRVQLGAVGYRKRSMLLAAHFYLELVVIHGFWDGVGRSSKLMRDWLLRYLGFQAPASTPENDLEYLADEYAVVLEEAVKVSEMRMMKKNIRESQVASCEETLVPAP